MDPTLQRTHRPLKAMLDGIVYGASTYLLPAIVALLVLITVERMGAHLLAVVSTGAIYYWGTALEATTAYRRHLAVPRAIDYSLDPPAGKYLSVLICRCLIALPLPVLLVLSAGQPRAYALVLAGAALIWLFVGLRELAAGQLHGRPYIEGGSMGPRVKPVRLLRQATRRHARHDEPTIWWGGVWLPLETILTNYLLLGATGSGKTLVLKAYLAVVLPLVVKFRTWRAMVIDPKWELVPYTLRHTHYRYKHKIVNPGDARTYAWAICKDLTHEVHFNQAAHAFLPERDESQPFFNDAARAIGQATMMSLNLQNPDDWWFSDFLFAGRNPKRLETILNLHAVSRDVFRSYANNRRVWFDVYSTFSSRQMDLYPVAAVWQAVQRTYPNRVFSLSEWVQGNYTLHIGKLASAEASQGRIIQLALKKASQLLLDQQTGMSTLPPETARRTIIAIDEAARVGNLDIMDLATNGRDYGVSLCCASQSIDALLEHYDRSKWDAISNEFHTLALLSSNSPTTLKWMSERLGNTDGRLPQPQADKPRKPRAQGEWSPTLDPSQFHTLRHGKKIGPHCIPGIFLNSSLGAWYSDEGVDLPPPLDGVPAHVPVPDDWQTLKPWDDADLERLRLTHLRDELDLDSEDDSPPPVPSKGGPPRTRPPRTTSTSYPRYRP